MVCIAKFKGGPRFDSQLDHCQFFCLQAYITYLVYFRKNMYYCVMTNLTNFDLKLIVLFKLFTKGHNGGGKCTEVN